MWNRVRQLGMRSAIRRRYALVSYSEFMKRQRRLSEQESGMRKHYRDWFAPMVNNPLDGRHFSMLVYDPKTKTRKPSEDEEFPLIDVADAIKDVVAGEEDADRERLMRGAEYLRRMCEVHPIRHLIASRERIDHVGNESVYVKDRKTGEPMLEVYFEEVIGEPDNEAWERFGFRQGSSEWNNSVCLCAAFSRYYRDYKNLIQFGVCHDSMCGRLYVKTKGKPHQRFCSSRCRERERYRRQKEDRRPN